MIIIKDAWEKNYAYDTHINKLQKKNAIRRRISIFQCFFLYDEENDFNEFKSSKQQNKKKVMNWWYSYVICGKCAYNI